jgi:hypothetical protein
MDKSGKKRGEVRRGEVRRGDLKEETGGNKEE